MPHQCVRCNFFYDDGSKELIQGCSKCGGKFFFYVKKESIKKAQEFTRSLSRKDIEKMERDVIDIIGDKFEDDKPIVLDLENIKVMEPGKFELDLVELFSGKPLVYKLEEGKYFIDIPSTFAAKDLSLKKKEERQEALIDDKDPKEAP